MTAGADLATWTHKTDDYDEMAHRALICISHLLFANTYAIEYLTMKGIHLANMFPCVYRDITNRAHWTPVGFADNTGNKYPKRSFCAAAGHTVKSLQEKWHYEYLCHISYGASNDPQWFCSLHNLVYTDVDVVMSETDRNPVLQEILAWHVLVESGHTVRLPGTPEKKPHAYPSFYFWPDRDYDCSAEVRERLDETISLNQRLLERRPEGFL